jgi:RNA polymerase subunit RPABC4/transcription elongation factor Spt4
MFFVIFILYFLIIMLPSMLLAERKKRSVFLAFIGSLLFGIFALIYYIVVGTYTPKISFNCTECNAKVGEDDEFCPSCGAKFVEEDKECMKCHTVNLEDTSFCKKCGHSFKKSKVNNHEK